MVESKQVNPPLVVETTSQLRGEIALRELALSVVQSLSAEQKTRVTELVVALYPDLDSSNLTQHVMDAIQTAERGRMWANDDQISRMGYYSSESMFFTMFWHEVGHNILRRLGTKASTQTMVELDREENFCWIFAKLMCELVEVAHQQDVIDLYKDMWLAVKELSADVESDRLIETLLREAQMFGYSYFDFANLAWTEQGVPYLVG